MTEAETVKHPTLAEILQGVLSGKGFYSGSMDCIIGTTTHAAIKAMTGSEKIDSDMWYTLFN